MGIAKALRRAKSLVFGGTATERGGTTSFMGSDLSAAARLAAERPGMSRAEFEEAFGGARGTRSITFFGQERRIPTGSGSVEQLWNVYRQLTSGTGGPTPTSAADVTSPEPEGPGRFQATRPGDLLGASDLRFG